MLLEFETPEEHARYAAAWEKFLERKAKIQGSGCKNESLLILVQFLIFRMEASLIKARPMARLLNDGVNRGYAVIYAENFKPAIAKVCQYLYNDYNVPREQISLIWGGDARFTGQQERISGEDIQRELAKAAVNPEGVDMKFLKKILMQLQVDTMGLSELPPELELGIQTRDKRQFEIDKFQSGKSLYCMFTFGAGGAGLSLHHRWDFLRPRRTYIAATYNEMEHEQAIGRGHRINSLSDTEQTTVLYKGTIEQRVLARRIQKGTCLNVIMDHTELTDYADADEILGVTAVEDGEEMNEREFEEIENETK